MILIGASQNSRKASRSVIDFHDNLLCTDKNEDGNWQDRRTPDDYMEEGYDTETVWRSVEMNIL